MLLNGERDDDDNNNIFLTSRRTPVEVRGGPRDSQKTYNSKKGHTSANGRHSV